MAQITLNSTGVASSGSLVLQSNGTTAAVTVDTAQNVGIGVTPSAWQSGRSIIELGGSVTGQVVFNGSSNNGFIATNVYNSGSGNLYKNSSYATSYNQTSGQHQWYTAASGTAGNAITFTQAMTLDASGNLGLGVTPSAWASGWRTLQIGAGANFIGRTGIGNQLQLIANGYYNGTNYIYQNNGEATQYYQSGGVHVWATAANGTAGNAITFNEAARIDSSGNFLVGTTSQAGRVTILADSGNNVSAFRSAGAVSTTRFARFDINTSTEVGSIQYNGTGTSYLTSSDYRLKENIAPISNALQKVAALKPCVYTWKSNGERDEGFIAHELAEVCPRAVSGVKDATRIEQYEISPAVPATYDEEGNELTPAVEAVMGEHEVPVYQSIDTSFLVATLTAAIQELNAKVVALEAKVK